MNTAHLPLQRHQRLVTLVGTFAILVGQSAINADSQSNQTPASPLATNEVGAFTGKVKIHCAPLRIAPAADAAAISECERAQLVQVIGSDGDFYAVEPPSKLKAYVASRYVVNHRVVGDRVNIRARPNTESQILGQVNNNDELRDRTLPQISEWVEIPFPANRKLYMRKELITNVGDSASFAQLQQQRADIALALQTAVALAEKAYGQFKDHSFASIPWSEVRAAFETAENLAASSPAFAELAQSIEQSQQVAFEGYQRAFSETAHSVSTPQDGDSAPEEIAPKRAVPATHTLDNPWAQIEQNLLQQWLDANPEKHREQYLGEQELAAIRIEGTLAPFERTDLRCKPGDYILYRQNLPIAYLYSATVDLQPFTGRFARFKVVKRPDYGFALPAYCALSGES